MNTQGVVGAVALIVGVALGAVAGTWIQGRNQEERVAAAVHDETVRAEGLESELSELRERAVLRDLHLRLGRIAIEADRQDYGTAGERAARFFDDLARFTSETAEGDSERSALRHVLEARDEIVAGLATAQPASAQRLGELYLEIFSMTTSPSVPDADVPR